MYFKHFLLEKMNYFVTVLLMFALVFLLSSNNEKIIRIVKRVCYINIDFECFFSVAIRNESSSIAKAKTARDFFQILKDSYFFTPQNVIVMQFLLRETQCTSLFEKCTNYAKENCAQYFEQREIKGTHAFSGVFFVKSTWFFLTDFNLYFGSHSPISDWSARLQKLCTRQKVLPRQNCCLDGRMISLMTPHC